MVGWGSYYFSTPTKTLKVASYWTLHKVFHIISASFTIFSEPKLNNYENPVTDVCKIGRLALESANTGMVIAGGGVAKHHICLANSMVIVPPSKIVIFTYD